MVPQDFGWIMQAEAGGGQFETSVAGEADTISQDRVPQCWGEAWEAAWGERGPAQLSWRLWVSRWGDCCNLGSGQSTRRVPACP